MSEANSDNDETMKLARRIRAFRQSRRLSLRRLAEVSGASPSFLSQLERGLSGASVSMLMQIASALGISVADLFDEKSATGPKIIGRNDRPTLPKQDGYRKALISQRPVRAFEAYVGEFDVGGTTGKRPYTHGDSQELMLVLRGEVEVTLGDEAYLLIEGDSIEYSTSIPHTTVNSGDQPAEVLWIISPPTSSQDHLQEYRVLPAEAAAARGKRHLKQSNKIETP
jgi:transcriptional regulator with XRE-family HTH domain